MFKGRLHACKSKVTGTINLYPSACKTAPSFNYASILHALISRNKISSSEVTKAAYGTRLSDN